MERGDARRAEHRMGCSGVRSTGGAAQVGQAHLREGVSGRSKSWWSLRTLRTRDFWRRGKNRGRRAVGIRSLLMGPAPVLPARHGATPQTTHPQACPEEPILSARFNPFPSASPVPSPLCPLFSMEIRVPLSLCAAPRSHATPSQPWALPLRRRAQLRVHSLAHRQWEDIEGVFLPHAIPRTSLVHSPSPAPAMALISSF